MNEQQPSSSSNEALLNESKPPCLIVLGMAGSGKSSFVQRLTAHLHSKKIAPYVINLDPAVMKVPYPANIDIRDTVKYKEVMREYGLGPNGAIMTCLNLLCTRFDQVLDILKKREATIPYCIIDTPGQIEAFTWSASGSIITDTLASTYPTMIAYVIDSSRAVNPTTFMSNMLYACSILYRSKLPFFLVLNKADIVKPTFITKWMNDFEEFQEALDETQGTYMNDLTRSLSLVLDSFYEGLNSVMVSSTTGEGIEQVLEVIEKCKKEYSTVYKPMYDKLLKERQEIDAQKGMEKLIIKEHVESDVADEHMK
uniref:GPN-loop GTPase n=1 Tax=Acrobeloides nanus TaxID=290746 RepID=A0A914C3P0_9BILA